MARLIGAGDRPFSEKVGNRSGREERRKNVNISDPFRRRTIYNAKRNRGLASYGTPSRDATFRPDQLDPRRGPFNPLVPMVQKIKSRKLALADNYWRNL